MTERIRQWLISWLGVGQEFEMLCNQDDFNLRKIFDLEKRITELEKPKPELNAADILERSKVRKQVPIRVTREPFRKLRAIQEQTLDPQYRANQQRIRDEQAKQPRSNNAS